MVKKAPNSKVVAANAKKAEAADKKSSVKAAQVEAQESREWQLGSNQRKAARDEAANAKADEAARKKREKAELLEAEERALSGGGTKPKTGGAAAKKKNPKNDLALLENALVSAAEKKEKQKRADLRAKEEREKQDQDKEISAVPQTETDKLLAATESILEGDVGRQANLERAALEASSGIDDALSSLGINADAPKSAKALYSEFEARMLPIVKEEFPGLRLSQYKEKIWQMWKKSPENPANQVPAA